MRFPILFTKKTILFKSKYNSNQLMPSIYILARSSLIALLLWTLQCMGFLLVFDSPYPVSGNQREMNIKKKSIKPKTEVSFDIGYPMNYNDISQGSNDKSCRVLGDVAEAIGSKAFLEMLVSSKNTKDVRYFVEQDDDNESSKIISCEYIGTLWFMTKKGVHFRESLRIDRSSDDKAVVECRTKFKNGKDKWVDCARALCSLKDVSTDYDEYGVRVEIGSELSMNVWLPPGVPGTVTRKISRTFEDAVCAFFGKKNK